MKTQTHTKNNPKKPKMRVLTEKCGLWGFKNLGNTCYFNSSLQCLFATLPLTKYFLNKEYEKHVKYMIKPDNPNIFLRLYSRVRL